VTTAEYAGSELDLFADARNWKAYLRKEIAPYLSGDVLEVGAGIGSFTRTAAGGNARRWVCLEPDPGMHDRLQRLIRDGGLPASCTAVLGGTESISTPASFDAVLYVDVLEHIDDDAAEMRRALGLLRPGGRLVVMSPAHQWLYTPFDKSIGHFRRYTRRTLAAVGPPGASLTRLRYLDSAGLLASLGNKLLLRSAMPTRRQIAFWDRVLVPMSRGIDVLVFHSIGKSVLGVWRRDPA
jgi:2-polyprenyl-3-methyl-5-hydroxy-6-metoxy-1,4-benzoquinol methylase